MKERSKKRLEAIILLAVAAIGALAYSQTYSATDRIFITDHLFITPKSEPHFYVAFIFLNIFLFLVSIYVAYRLVIFLLARDILVPVGGVFLLIMAATLSVVWFVLEGGPEETIGYIVSGIIVLILAVFGLVMLFGVPGRGKKKGR
jgi:hypothetical protein